MQKYSAFLNLISRYENNEFDDDSLIKEDTFSLFGKEEPVQSQGNTDQGKDKLRQTQKGGELVEYRETHQKSIEMVNKLLGVLFNEWCNSEFFHEFVKEELLVSLNRKRPEVVENLNI